MDFDDNDNSIVVNDSAASYLALQRQLEYEAAEMQRKEGENIDRLISIVARTFDETDVKTFEIVFEETLSQAEQYGKPAVAAIWLASLVMKAGWMDQQEVERKLRVEREKAQQGHDEKE